MRLNAEQAAARETRVLRVRALFDSGLKFDDIGMAMGLSKSAVCSIAFKNHFPKRRPRRQPAPCKRPAQVARAAGARAPGFTIQQGA